MGNKLTVDEVKAMRNECMRIVNNAISDFQKKTELGVSVKVMQINSASDRVRTCVVDIDVIL